MRLKVFRFDRETGKFRYDTLEIELSAGMTVLLCGSKSRKSLKIPLPSATPAGVLFAELRNAD